MDKLERTVANERMERDEDDTRRSLPEDAGLDHPALKPIHDKMVSSHQRKMQQLAAREKELDRQMQQMSAMQTMMQQGNNASGHRESVPQNTGEFDWLEEEVRPLLSDPSATPLRGLVRSMEKRFGKREADPVVSQLQETINALQQRLERTESSVVQERYSRQIPDFKKKYGDSLDEDQQRSVLEYALKTGSDLERALYAVSPETALAQERTRMEAEIRKSVAAEYGASLEGMEDIIASKPQTDRSPVSKDGKLVDFRDTALDILGKGGMMRAMREGFDRTPVGAQEGE